MNLVQISSSPYSQGIFHFDKGDFSEDQRTCPDQCKTDGDPIFHFLTNENDQDIRAVCRDPSRGLVCLCPFDDRCVNMRTYYVITAERPRGEEERCSFCHRSFLLTLFFKHRQTHIHVKMFQMIVLFISEY